MSKYEWMDKALCREVDPELFHPTKESNFAHRAKAVCAQCKVRSECLSWGLENPDMQGVLGGMTERERKMYRSRLRKQSA